nr:unnamed protein product [Callosobruchus analis]
MFLQIKVKEHQPDLLRVLWRSLKRLKLTVPQLFLSEEAIQAFKDIFSILISSGFMLGKWKSNSVTVLNAMQTINASNAQPVLTQEKTKHFVKLKGVFAFVLRFIYNTRTWKSKILGPLTVSEVSQATKHLDRVSQGDSFSPEISILEKGKHLLINSRFLKLNPFLGSENILRVGERLHFAKLDYNHKHPMLLSSKHPLTAIPW